MPTTQTRTEDHPTLEHVPLDQVRIVEEFNARRQMSETKLAELTASVTNRGVIQPIIVHRAPTGEPDSQPFVLVAGHRRIEASRLAKLTTIPALIYNQLDTATKMQIALVENLQREDLNPIDEALGYQRAMQQPDVTQTKLAALTGTNKSRISERLALLKLPDGCQRLIASDEVPVAAARTLTQIAAVAPALADGCASLLARGTIEASELIDQPHVAIDVLGEQDEPETPFVLRVDAREPIQFRGALTQEQIQTLIQRAEAAGLDSFDFTPDDVDAARSYGCLLEFTHQFGAHRFLTDAKFVHDRICLHIDQIEADAQHAATEQPTAGNDTPSGGTPADAAGDATESGAAPSQVRKRLRELRTQQATRDAERAAQLKVKTDAITANRQLGANLAKRLGSKTVDRDTARLLAEMVLRQNPRMAGRGIRYTHPEYHSLEHIRQKNHKTRTVFTPAEPHDAHEQVVEWVLRPAKAEEIIGRLLQTIIAATFADQNAVAQSNRAYWDAPTFQTDICALIAKLAKRTLPEHFHPHAEQLLPTPKTASKRPTSKPDTKHVKASKPAATKRKKTSDAA